MTYHYDIYVRYEEHLENSARMLNPTAPYDIMLNEIRRDWIYDWQIS